MTKRTVCYFGTMNMSFSRNKVFSEALKAKGVDIIECSTQKTGIHKYFDLYKKHRKIQNTYDSMIVGFPGFVVAPFARLISNKKVILDALSSRYDSDIISRNAHEGSWFKKTKILFVDWLAFRFSHLILVETEAQKEFISRKFKINKNKIIVVYTGVDEVLFKKDSSIQKYDTFTVIFRGRVMSEAGLPEILKAAKILENENINFQIIGFGWGDWILESKNIYKTLDANKVSWIESEIPVNDLLIRLQKSHISLGQFGNSERLDRTIPHKAFEAMILGIPYLTKGSNGIREAFEDSVSCIMVAGSPESIAEGILKLKNDFALMKKIAIAAEENYWNKFSYEKIATKLCDNIFTR